MNQSDDFLRGLLRENPVFVQVLGLCPVLAVTGTMVNSLAMGLATAAVLVLSSFFVSILRRWIPREVRIAVYILIIATFVTVADMVIEAVSLEIHAQLGAFVSLIVVNCLILSRAEAFASKNGPLAALADAAGMGLGFTLAILAVGFVREVLGQGTVFGRPVFGADFQPWLVFALPGGAFFALSGLLVAFQWMRGQRGAR